MRLVLDTNVMVAAFRSPTGASARLVEAAVNGQVTLLGSTALLLEYEAVLLRADHLTAARLTREEMQRALMTLADVCEPVEIDWSLRPAASDPDDDLVVEAVVNGRADALVTFEVRTFRGALKRHSIAVMTPADAWRKVK